MTDMSPTDRPPDLYMEGFQDGTRYLRTWCAISAFIGVVGGTAALFAVVRWLI